MSAISSRSPALHRLNRPVARIAIVRQDRLDITIEINPGRRDMREQQQENRSDRESK